MVSTFLVPVLLQAIIVDVACVAALTLPPACSFIPALISSCESSYPGFDDLDAARQAECVCYSSAVWVPDRFDQSILSCAEYLETAEPVAYATISALEGFCQSVGNIFTPTSSTNNLATKPTSAVLVAITPISTAPAPTLPIASSVGNIVSGGGTTTSAASTSTGKTPTSTRNASISTPLTTSKSSITTSQAHGASVAISSSIIPSTTSSKAGAGSPVVREGAVQNSFLGLIGVIIAALAWL